MATATKKASATAPNPGVPAPSKTDVKPATGSQYLDRMRADDVLGECGASTPFMQILSKEGALFITREQGDKVGFNEDLLEFSNWECYTATLGGQLVEGYKCSHLRAVIVFKDSVWDDETSRYNNLVYLIPVSDFNESDAINSNIHLTNAPLRLKLKGGSVPSGTWYSLVDNPKSDGSWLQGVFGCFEQIYKSRGGKMAFQSGILLDIQTRTEIKGTGQNKSAALVFHSVVTPTLEHLESGELDAYADDSDKDHILSEQAKQKDATEKRREYKKVNAQNENASDASLESEDGDDNPY